MTFWLVAAILALAAALLVIRPLTARRRAVSRAEADAALYKAQLAEIDRDLARGTIGPEEAGAARVEVSRRLLAADRQAAATGALGPAPAGHSRALAVAAALAVPAAGAGVYLATGSPSLPGRPYAERGGERALAAEMQRPSQEAAERRQAETAPPRPAGPTADEARYRELVAQIEAMLPERPDDRQGRELLVEAYLRLGRHADRWRMQRELIALRGAEATADDHAVLVEGMVMAAGGYVSPEAEAALERLRALDPDHPAALFYSGLVLAQAGRAEEAARIWQALRAALPDGSPQAEQVEGMLAALRSGDARGPGPDAAAIGAAAGMSPEERRGMIEAMVAGLGARLAAEGGPVEDWLRLILSLRQLGREGEARAALEAAAADHAGDAAALATLRERAAAMGVRPQ